MCYRIQVLESTSNQLMCSIDQLTYHRTRVINLTSNQLMCSGEQVMCYRIQVLESTSNQLMCSIDQLTQHRTRVINLTSNQLMCQMPLPCTLTFKVSSIKHQTLIHFPSPFLYPNIQHQIPRQAHPHRPKRQYQTTNRLTNPHSICTSPPSKERVQATNNRLPTNTQSVHPLPRRGLGRPSPSYCFPPISCKFFSQPSFFVVQWRNISCTKPSLFVNALVL